MRQLAFYESEGWPSLMLNSSVIYLLIQLVYNNWATPMENSRCPVKTPGQCNRQWGPAAT